MAAHALKARVENGKVIVDEPTDLPDGEIYLLPVSPDALMDEHAASDSIEPRVTEEGDDVRLSHGHHRARIEENRRHVHKRLPETPPSRLEDLPQDFTLFDDALLSVVYAPIDYVNRDARIVILGITPGWQQTRIAFETAASMRGADEDEVGRAIKRAAAFAGAMRKNLISMLDELGLHHLLGIRSATVLFAERADLLHSTSVLRYPVFKAGRNYSGHGPKPPDHPFLAAMLEHLLVPELALTPHALIIPLGRCVQDTLQGLSERGLLASTRWLRGFPHPSAANGHRKAQFALAKSTLASSAARWLGAMPPIS